MISDSTALALMGVLDGNGAWVLGVGRAHDGAKKARRWASRLRVKGPPMRPPPSESPIDSQGVTMESKV